VIWPIYGLKIDYDKVKLQNIRYDIIFMMSQRLRHRKYVIKMTRQKIFHFQAPS